MDQAPTPTAIRRALLVVSILPALFGVSFLGVFPWSGLNSWRDEIDINSGRTRQSCQIFWISFPGPAQDSPLTTALATDDLAGRAADWRVVNTFSPRLHHSPHHVFHGAIGQIRMLSISWDIGKSSRAERSALAREVIHLWNRDQNDRAVSSLLDRVWRAASRPDPGGGRA